MVKVSELSRHGLMEITRKRVSSPVLMVFLCVLDFLNFWFMSMISFTDERQVFAISTIVLIDSLINHFLW